MALKLNILPAVEEEMDALLPRTQVRSKTEYINRAIEEYNRKLKREMELKKLSHYFHTYNEEGRKILHEFARLKKPSD